MTFTLSFMVLAPSEIERLQTSIVGWAVIAIAWSVVGCLWLASHLRVQSSQTTTDLTTQTSESGS
jgi:hypothetical protein